MRKSAIKLSSVLLVSTMLIPFAAHAEEDDDNMIVVTAQRREQNLQDVSISISAFNNKQLESLGVSNTTELAEFTPGVSATGAQGGFLQTFSIRGVTMSDYNPHQEGPIAVYRDDVYISSLQGQSFATFDTERVEILKGPQGTLFGRNATGGLVNYITKKPGKEFEGHVSGKYGSFGSAGFEAAVGGPLGDKFGIRISGIYDKTGANLKNAAGPDYNDNKTAAARLQLQFDASDSLRLRLAGQIGKSNFSISGGQQYLAAITELDAMGRKVNARLLGATEVAQVIANGANVGTRPVAGGDFFGYADPDGSGPKTSDPYVGDRVSYTTNVGDDRNSSLAHSATAHVEWDVSDDITLTSLSDYSFFKWRSGAGLFGGGTQLIGFDTYSNGIKQYSQELRLNGSTDTIDWVLGGYYLDIKSDNGAGFGLLFGSGDQLLSYQQKTKSASVFGQVEWEFLPGLSATLGGRYIKEKKNFQYSLAFVSPPPAPVSTPLYTFNTATNPLAAFKDNLWSMRAALNYKVNDDVLLYASFNRGVKAGGFNAPTGVKDVAVDPGLFRFEPEVLLAYEAGFKTTLLDGMMRFNGAGFYYDYSNYQAYQNFAPGRNYLINNNARVYGGEIDLSLFPADGLTINAGGAYTNAVVKGVNITGGDASTAIFRDVAPAFSPKLQLNGFVRYELPVNDGWSVGLQADSSYRSSYSMQLNNFDLLRQKAYALVNLRANLFQTDGGFNISASVRNIFDKYYKVAQFDTSSDFGNSIITFNRGRTWQIAASMDF